MESTGNKLCISSHGYPFWRRWWHSSTFYLRKLEAAVRLNSFPKAIRLSSGLKCGFQPHKWKRVSRLVLRCCTRQGWAIGVFLLRRLIKPADCQLKKKSCKDWIITPLFTLWFGFSDLFSIFECMKDECQTLNWHLILINFSHSTENSHRQWHKNIF